MTLAQELLEQIRHELAPIEVRLRDHPYLQALDQGQIPKERLGVFAGEQYVTIQSDLRSLAALVARCEDPRSRRLFLGVLPGEDIAFSTLHDFATALGLDETWLEAYEPTPEAQAYAHYVAWLAHYASPPEMAAALAVNFPVWGANCGRVGASLRDRYCLSVEATVFLTCSLAPPPATLKKGYVT